MTKTFTQIDAMRYVYGELNANEKLNFERAMLVDLALRTEVKELKNLKKNLDEVNAQPSQNVLDNILCYSKSFNLHSEK